MKTRFRTASAYFVMDAPMIRIPPNIPGTELIGDIGGAYEHEVEFFRQWVIRQAGELKATLETAEMQTIARVPEFLAAMNKAIDFLQGQSEDSVWLYSYERSPSISFLLEDCENGSVAEAWVLAELNRKGEKARNPLLTALKKERDSESVLNLVAWLLMSFDDEETRKVIRSRMPKWNPDLAVEVGKLLDG